MFLVTAMTNTIGFIQHRLDREESGASMVEYALLVALIAAVCIVILAFLGTSISNLFQGVATKVCGVATSNSAANCNTAATAPS
jgi:pilus assembly protein Flp/PilA